MPRRTPRSLRPSGWIALLAILLQALLPAWHHPADASPSGLGAGLLARNLCVAPGSAPSEPAKQPAHHLPVCPICQTLHMLGGGFVPPDPIQLPTAMAVVPRLAAAADTPIHAQGGASRIRVRGPPSPA